MYSRLFHKAETDLRRLRTTSATEAAKFEKNLRLGQTMVTAGATLTAGSYMVSRAFDGMKQSAIELDQAVADVSTVMTNLERRPEFLARALETSSKSMFNASQILREGAYNLLSAGLSEEEALAILPKVAQLAMGTFDDVAGATNNATTVMMSYKAAWRDMSAEEKAIRTTDALARAIQLFKFVGPQIGVTLQYAAAAAAAANVPLEDMLATIGTMKTAGLEASMAGTSYRMMLERLPEVQKKTGVAVTDSVGRMRPLVDILGDLKKRYGEVLTVAELKELSKIFGTEAAGGVKALLMNFDELVRQTENMNKPGAALEMYTRRMAGAGAQMQALKNEYTEASAVLATKMLPLMRQKQELLIKAVRTMERLPVAKEALLGVDLVAELGKLAGPLITAIGLWKIYHTQQQIALALQAQLNATTAAGGAAGAVARTAGPSVLAMAGPIGAGLAAGGGLAYGSWTVGQAIAKKLGIMTFDDWRRRGQGGHDRNSPGVSDRVPASSNIQVLVTLDGKQIAGHVKTRLTRDVLRDSMRE